LLDYFAARDWPRVINLAFLILKLKKMFHFVFQDRMVIVDSPGVGESEIMDDIVVNYLPNAFAFIYVINSGNAGGVQKDRVSVNLCRKSL